jgi:prolyl-tRNA editing enzyme YbaK/EbsC (Cys-tRNA(Pro) deacylase)
MAKESISKTNAARLLDQLGIQYELCAYEVDPEDLAAETVAAKIGLRGKPCPLPRASIRFRS